MKYLFLVGVVVLSCTLGAFGASGVVTVQSPANNASVTSPVAIHATYNGTASYMKLWIDHVATTVQSNTSTFSYSATLASGAHLLEIQAADATSKVVYTTPVNITVTAGGGGGGGGNAVTVQSPANNSTVASPVAVQAKYSGTASYMKLWVDHVATALQSNTSTFSYSATLAAGAHVLEIQAADATSGIVYTTSVNITVTTGGGGGGGGPVTVQSPANGSTDTSPVAVQATYSGTASYMKLWIDHVSIIAQPNTSTFIYSAPLSNGAHLLEIQAADATSKTVYTTPVNITVVAKPTVSVSPSSATVVEGLTQQFAASGTTGTVTWSVAPSTVGTIDQTGLFTSAATTGIATVTASDSGTGASASASVSVVAFSITPNPANVALGANVTLTANAPANWAVSSGSGSISTTSTPSTSAIYTAPTSAGAATITATESANNAITATDTLTAASFAVTPATANTYEGQTQQFTVNDNATWSTTCGSITSGGLFTAPYAVEDCTITAAETGTSNSATAIDHVTAAPIQALNYTMWKNDLGGTGQQRNELILTPANVNASTFGVKFSTAVDGWVFAQPLYMSGLTVNSATHNVVFVATEHDSVYAFDADTAGAALWKQSFLKTGVTTVPQANVGSTIFPEIGITGTPVIDPATGTLYVVAETLESGKYFHRLHALDVTTGSEKFGGPVVIQPSGFASKEQLQRPGLTLANGNVYVSLGSQGDIGSYHGWVIAYSATTLAQVAAWNDSPGGVQGGIWSSGAAPSVDSNGNLYISSGNGSFNGTTQFSMSIVKLSPSLTVLDWFTPWNAVVESKSDEDLGSGGVLVVPDQSGAYPHELIECGKLPQVYVLNRDNLGHQLSTSDSQLIQELSGVVGGGPGTQSPDSCFMTPAYWEQNLYIIANNDVIKQFTLDPSTGLMSTTPVEKGSFEFVFPGGQPVTSSDGSSNGIVWAIDASGKLHAFDATNVSTTLYTSGTLVPEKFAVPTVVNGKVFVAGQGKLFVFGLF